MPYCLEGREIEFWKLLGLYLVKKLDALAAQSCRTEGALPGPPAIQGAWVVAQGMG